MRRKDFARLRVLLLILALSLVACGGREPETEPTAQVQPTAQQETVPTTAPPATDVPPPTDTPAPVATEGPSGLELAQMATVQVVVQGSQFLEEFIGSGSGVIYDPSGLILTNNHVVEGAAIVQVAMEGRDSLISARVLGKSPCDDLAVIQISGSGFPSAPLGGAAATVGTPVYAIGYPLGDPIQSLTSGIISKVHLAVPTSFADYSDAMQTDTAINPGNSGGPLVNADGVVVGINSAGLSSAQGTNFAISGDYAATIAEQLEQGENLNWVGLNAAPLPAEVAAENGIALEPGLFVYAVDSGSPADITGILEGDFITSVEGIAVGADGTLKTFCDVLRSHDADDTLDVSVVRAGARYAGQINGRELEGGESVAGLGGEEGGETGGGETGGGEVTDPALTNFVEVADATGRITLQLPDVWDISVIDLQLWGSGELDPWLASFGGTGEGEATVAGFFIAAVDEEAAVDDAFVVETLDGLPVPANCEFIADNREEYDDGLYRGVYDLMECDSGQYITLITFDPANPSFWVWIEAYLITDQDYEIFDNALATFLVSPG